MRFLTSRKICLICMNYHLSVKYTLYKLKPQSNFLIILINFNKKLSVIIPFVHFQIQEKNFNEFISYKNFTFKTNHQASVKFPVILSNEIIAEIFLFWRHLISSRNRKFFFSKTHFSNVFLCLLILCHLMKSFWGPRVFLVNFLMRFF